MKYRLFVDGQEGTTGLRINEYLAARQDIEVLRIDPDRRKDPAERARLLNAADVAERGLPERLPVVRSGVEPPRQKKHAACGLRIIVTIGHRRGLSFTTQQTRNRP